MNRFSTRLLPLLAVALLLGLSSCGKPSPKDVAKQAVEAQLADDLQSFYDLLCAEDQEAITYDNFLTKYTCSKDVKALFDLVPEAHDVLKAGSYKEIVNGEAATVTYVLTVPDMDRIVKEAIDFDLLRQMMNGTRMRSLADLPEGMKDNIRRYVADHKIPTTETPQTMTLVRENDLWKVSLHLRDALRLGEMPVPFEL